MAPRPRHDQHGNLSRLQCPPGFQGRLGASRDHVLVARDGGRSKRGKRSAETAAPERENWVRKRKTSRNPPLRESMRVKCTPDPHGIAQESFPILPGDTSASRIALDLQRPIRLSDINSAAPQVRCLTTFFSLAGPPLATWTLARSRAALWSHDMGQGSRLDRRSIGSSRRLSWCA
jgi:hypothetical protein